MKRFLLAYLLLLAVCQVLAQNSPQQPQAKEALLIANGDYAHFGKLPNPISDERLLGRALERIGFHVAFVENASREGMLDALQAFQDRLKTSHGIALFHYGGHGVQVNGRNYLIPVDADIPDERKVSTRAVDLEEVMTTLDGSGSDVNVVVLDACRDNPLPATSSRSASRGLSVVQTKPKNSLIVYAAEPGSKAEDGLFTPSLADAITSPGKSLSQIFKEVRKDVYHKSAGSQTPGEYDQLFEDVFLNSEGGLKTPQFAVTSKPSQQLKDGMEPAETFIPVQTQQFLPDAQFPAQATIQDPDGYTNIRKSPTTNSEIIGTVNEGDIFLVCPNASTWWKVKTKEQRVGFIHKSRINIKKYSVTGLDPNGDNWLALKSAPDLKSERLRKLSPDTPLTLLSRNGIWMQVRLDDGAEGWVYSKYVKPR